MSDGRVYLSDTFNARFERLVTAVEKIADARDVPRQGPGPLRIPLSDGATLYVYPHPDGSARFAIEATYDGRFMVAAGVADAINVRSIVKALKPDGAV